MEDLLRSFPVLVVDDELDDDTAAGRSTRAVVEQLEAEGAPVLTARRLEDAEQVIDVTAMLSGLVIDWEAVPRLPARRPENGRVPVLGGSLPPLPPGAAG
jgi:hypothetical protein